MSEMTTHILKAIKAARERQPAVRYNSNMLMFLCEQLGTVERLIPLLPEDRSEETMAVLKAAADDACLLVRRHAEVFKVDNFYKVDYILRRVERICCDLKWCFEYLDIDRFSEIKTEVEDKIVDEDRAYMHWYLRCILDGQNVDKKLPDDVRMDLEKEISKYKHLMSFLTFIKEEDVKRVQKIGDGENGDIFEGEWDNLTVAVKVLRKDLTPEARAEFITEVKMHMQINHPHVVRCFGATLSHTIVMEYAMSDLEKFLKKQFGSLTIQLKLSFMVNASAGLKHLHNARVVHRDVKTSNFLVFKGDTPDTLIVKIGDFGLARAKTETMSRTARPLMGTMLWMAPEIQSGEPHTFSSDVFSFGLVLYSIASGTQPYGGISNEVLLLGRKKNVVEPCVVPSDCPDDLKALMNICISPAASKRPTMNEVDKQLIEILRKVERQQN